MKTKYLVQRFHSSLQIGIAPFVWSGKKRRTIHCQQGTWDSACGAYCAAIALAILGHIADITSLSDSSNGVAARLWRLARETYFDGINANALCKLLEETGTGHSIVSCAGAHARCLEFTLSKLDDGQLVIVSWLSRYDHHWVVIVGVEGVQVGGKLYPTALLAIDPSVSEPYFTGYNGRLEFKSHILKKSVCIPYLTANDVQVDVRLTNAISIRNIT